MSLTTSHNSFFANYLSDDSRFFCILPESIISNDKLFTKISTSFFYTYKYIHLTIRNTYNFRGFNYLRTNNNVTQLTNTQIQCLGAHRSKNFCLLSSIIVSSVFILWLVKVVNEFSMALNFFLFQSKRFINYIYRKTLHEGILPIPVLLTIKGYKKEYL